MLLKHFSRRDKQTTFVAIGALRVNCLNKSERTIPEVFHCRLGEFGGVFIPAMCKPEDAQLYCTRPGFRLWKSAIDGTVNNTFMFKELLSQAHNEIPVGAFVVTSIEKAAPASQFGPLLLFHGQYLVTWNQSCLYVLDPERTCVVGTQKHVGQIKSVISTGDEIFILRRNTNRDLIRISTKPLPETGSKSK